MDTQYSYRFEDNGGMSEMQYVMKMFRCGFKTLGDIGVESVLDHSKGSDGIPGSGTIEYRLAGGSSVLIKSSGTEPKLEICISVKDNEGNADEIEKRVHRDLENIIYMDLRAGYCLE